MELQRLCIAYFSATLSTKAILLNVAWGLGLNVPVRTLDLTSAQTRRKHIQLEPVDLLLVGAPTYGGRLPQVEPSVLDCLHGNNTPAVAVVVYGERGYDDTLLEMRDGLADRGFIPLAAATFIAEHALSEKVGTGRPDKADIKKAQEFGAQLCERLRTLDADKLSDIGPVAIPGNHPYKDPPDMALVPPTTTDDCIFCMLCHRWCPTSAIPYNKPTETDGDRCIRCFACIKRCPTQARYLDDPNTKSRILSLEGMFSDIHGEPELFI